MAFTIARGGLKRGELAKRSGCNIETIRYYEKVGLLPPPGRTAAGHRVYDEADQRRLRFILRARDLDLSIEELRDLLALVDAGDFTCGEIHARAQAHLASVAQKIADLRKLKRTLEEISSECSRGETPDCPIIESLEAD